MNNINSEIYVMISLLLYVGVHEFFTAGAVIIIVFMYGGGVSQHSPAAIQLMVSAAIDAR